MRKHCRACGGSLESVLHLGNFALCGYFPLPHESVPYEPLGLSWCKKCSLVQMSYDYEWEMYGPKYGYRSSLNPSMVSHLEELGKEAVNLVGLESDSLVVDIGGNDGTLLKSLPPCAKVLVDPIGIPVEGIFTVPKTFDKSVVSGKARIVFSIAMFYDLQDPVGFAQDVSSILEDDGIWVFEQSYLPMMVRKNAYDTICHEHLEYYSLKSIRAILEMAGLQIVKASLNDCNGGSIRIYASHIGYNDVPPELEKMDSEFNRDVPTQLGEMFHRMLNLRANLQQAIYSSGKVVGYGASTKGNTLLQFCGIRLPSIIDVNPDKFGRVTPGTDIPIVDQDDADSYLVLPWHFRDFIIQKEQNFIENGGQLIFPLPKVEIVNASFTRSFVLGNGKRRNLGVYSRPS